MKTRLFCFTAILAFFMISKGNVNGQATPQQVVDAFSKSYNYEERGNFADAIAAMKGVYNENSYEINLRLGWLNYLSGSFTDGVAYYQKAINLKPYAIEAKFGFVLPAAALGNMEQVISQYNEILQIDPQNTLANYRVGMIWYGRQDWAKAEKYFEKVVNLYPFDYDSNIMYAWTCFKLGKLREAQVLFNKALMMRPNDTSAAEGLSLIKL
jgi:tetratricopeptide (TPR) repeat protein